VQKDPILDVTLFVRIPVKVENEAGTSQGFYEKDKIQKELH